MWVALPLSHLIRAVFNRLVGKVKQELRSRFVCKQEPGLFSDRDRIQGNRTSTILPKCKRRIRKALAVAEYSRC